GSHLRRQGIRRAARPLPADRQAGGVRATEYRERGAAQPQQHSRLPHCRCHGRSRRDRRPDRIPPSRRDDRFFLPLTGRGAFISLPRSGGGSGWELMPNEHFLVPPHWEWYILLYFFFAVLPGGV